MALAERFKVYPKQRPRLPSPYEAELSTSNLHGGIVVFRVIKRGIVNFVLDLIRFNYDCGPMTLPKTAVVLGSAQIQSHLEQRLQETTPRTYL